MFRDMNFNLVSPWPLEIRFYREFQLVVVIHILLYMYIGGTHINLHKYAKTFDWHYISSSCWSGFLFHIRKCDWLFRFI